MIALLKTLNCSKIAHFSLLAEVRGCGLQLAYQLFELLRNGSGMLIRQGA